MGLIDDTSDDLTVKKEIQKRIILSELNASFENIKSNFDRIAQFVWNNDQLHPRDVFAALGTQGKRLFVISSTMAQAVNSLVPNSSTPYRPYKFVINEDNSVTIGVPEEIQDPSRPENKWVKLDLEGAEDVEV